MAPTPRPAARGTRGRRACTTSRQRVFQASGDTGPSEGHLPLEPHSLPAAGTTPTPWIDENGVVTFETGTEFADANNVTVWGNWVPRAAGRARR